MPIYEYKCANGHVFDVIQKMNDEPLAECQECDAPAERVLHPVAVHFKGSGFYATDYGKKKPATSNGTSDSGGESKASKDSDSKQSTASKSDSSKSKATAARDSGS